MELKYGVFHVMMVSRIPMEYELYEKVVDHRNKMMVNHGSDLGKLVEVAFWDHPSIIREILRIVESRDYSDFRIIYY